MVAGVHIQLANSGEKFDVNPFNCTIENRVISFHTNHVLLTIGKNWIQSI